MRNRDKVRRRVAFAKDHGIEEAVVKFGKKRSTIERDIRRVRGWESPKDSYSAPKILLFDLETAYMEGKRIFRLGKQFISHDQITKGWSIISWSAKWLFEDTVMAEYVSGQQAIDREDKDICKSLWELIDEADLIIAHNLDGFDRKMMNTRFIMHGFNPPSPYRKVDTLKDVRKEFSFPSNSMAYLSKILLEREKMKTETGLWDRVCQDGDEEAIDFMVKYNKRDVVVLEDLYVKIRPWIKSHPNLGLYFDDIGKRCTNCGGKDLEKTGGFYYTSTGKYYTMRCNNCGAIGGRSRYCALSTDERRELLAPVAR